MVKLIALPDQAVIDGFKGKIDFYVHDGIQCVRKWPTFPPRKPSATEAEAQQVFASAVVAWTALPKHIRDKYKRWASASSFTSRDLFIKGYIGGIYRYPKEVVLLHQVFAYMSADMLNLTSGTEYKLVLDSEEYDTGDDFDTVNNLYLVPKTGRYLVCLNVGWHELNAVANRYFYLKADGAEVLTGLQYNTPGGIMTDNLSAILQFVAGQVLTAHARHFCGVDTPDIVNYKNWTNLSISLLE